MQSTPHNRRQHMSHRQPTHCALKARAIVAWGNAPGCGGGDRCGLKARAKTTPRHKRPPLPSTRSAPSIPHKPLVERNAILREHRPHLRLEIPPLMMRRLRINIPHQCRPIAQPHRKRRIPALPSELRELRPLGLDPLRRRNLQSLHQLRHRLRPRDIQRDMDVITHSTYPHANILRPNHRRQICVHLAADRVAQKRFAPLRAEDQMHQHVRERLRHDCKFSAGLQPAPVIATTSWGYAPGYKTAGLQPATAQT